MFDARSVRRLIILLAVLGAGVGSLTVPSMAQMIERSITNNAIQQAVQSARDRNQKSSGSQTKDAKASHPADTKQVQSAKRERKQDKKPTAAGQQQAARSPSGVPPAAERRYAPGTGACLGQTWYERASAPSHASNRATADDGAKLIGPPARVQLDCPQRPAFEIGRRFRYASHVDRSAGQKLENPRRPLRFRHREIGRTHVDGLKHGPVDEIDDELARLFDISKGVFFPDIFGTKGKPHSDLPDL
jgi:hypothetical protein